ncbi:type I restriction enzyme, R subunit [Fibrobacter sp. UWH9]|uniref:DEAD/DEAH box helicase family protein n=1 Tax=Fibrobacter sp. UWH9 TaxID=1896213 RepID=UPI000912187D|nr:DEAD/DEAH box helicase family protein [Fibrobacter sp. UWH9]SHH43183.1 type I restriction enzyme, R subunit [Fibrobacter sp. UWH9]
MMNFDYLKDCGLDHLYGLCSGAEGNQVQHPDICAINARRALEYVVKSIYAMKKVELPPKTALIDLIDGEPFSNFVNDGKVMRAAHYIRRIGNAGAHDDHVGKKESFFCLLNLYNVVASVLIKLKVVETVAPFDRTIIPDSKFMPTLAATALSIDSASALANKADKAALDDDTPVKEMPSTLSEAETRRIYIELMLREAGWDILDTEGTVKPSKACIEVEVDGMPNEHKIGYADYVLFGANGLPLAVVEAKKASVSPIKGKHQAELYADCLEKQYGVRPVIYYTNGFETNIIDGLGYPPRRLYSFHTEEDLVRLIQKRGRKDISDFSVKPNITDRHYQKMAIKSVCEWYNGKHRRGLLVMATGTGKTRVSISMVDVLMRNDWVKNVLFLADRTSLVSQAKKNFAKLLPNTSITVLSDQSNKAGIDPNARIVFSTYQTMINYIDSEEKPFSVGRFDLIIIDEAHRSVFGKYGAIFNYFDSLLLGLTATPRDEVEKSTYDLFGMEEGVPNYAYELEDAVVDKFLVNYRGFKRGSLILSEGIKYSSLSEQEKDQLERVWAYEETLQELDPNVNVRGRDIQSNEIFKYIYNEGTIDKVLQDLMENGLKVQSGERIGKSIIFAYNHKHAELIVQRFHHLYPEFGPEFCVLIDNYVTYSQDLIEKMEVRDNDPQIAVSVDMLDTGIDIPDVLNLVFFKMVKSKIKFMQMIGRGTRLSSNIFGAGKDKECFYIFDWCRNFEFFEKNPDGNAVKQNASLTEHLFGLRAEIAFHLQHQTYQEDEFCRNLHDELKAIMKGQVASLSDSHISVRNRWEAVSHFKSDDAWVCLTAGNVETLKLDIAPLLPRNTQDENAKKFDVLILAIELGYVNSEFNASKPIINVQGIAERLLNKATIPQVVAKMDTIKDVLNPTAWENMSLRWLEKVRADLRDLVKFLVGDGGKTFTVDIADIISNEGMSSGIQTRVTYKQKVMDYLATKDFNPVLQKIYNLEQLSNDDIVELERVMWKELGSKEDYDAFIDGMPCGENVAILIRSLIKVDRKLALERFNKFLSGSVLNADQEEFVLDIITYVCENGDITTDTVVNESPFDEQLEVFNDKIVALRKYIENIHGVVTPSQQA